MRFSLVAEETSCGGESVLVVCTLTAALLAYEWLEVGVDVLAKILSAAGMSDNQNCDSLVIAL